MDKDMSNDISNIATMLLANNKMEAKNIINQEYPHTYYEIEKTDIHHKSKNESICKRRFY